MNIDWFTFVAQIVNFVVLVFFLNRFLYGPITRAMSQREESIATRLHQAEQKQDDATVKLERYRHLSEELENQRKRLLEQARADSETTRQALVADARAEVQSRRDDWMSSLQREQKSLIDLIRQRASQQVISVSNSVLSQLANAELEQRILTNFLGQLKRIPPDQVEDLKSKVARNNLARVITAFDVSASSRSQICRSLDQQLGLKQVDFVTLPELICGIELHVNGCKIGWSMREHLESLTDEIHGLLTQDG